MVREIQIQIVCHQVVDDADALVLKKLFQQLAGVCHVMGMGDQLADAFDAAAVFYGHTDSRSE